MIGKNSLFNQSLKSYYHRNNGMKVYSSDINIDVYDSDQNRANRLLKATFVSITMFCHYIYKFYNTCKLIKHLNKLQQLRFPHIL